MVAVKMVDLLRGYLCYHTKSMGGGTNFCCQTFEMIMNTLKGKVGKVLR